VLTTMLKSEEEHLDWLESQLVLVLKPARGLAGARSRGRSYAQPLVRRLRGGRR
jgi:hypothetical protein